MKRVEDDMEKEGGSLCLPIKNVCLCVYIDRETERQERDGGEEEEGGRERERKREGEREAEREGARRGTEREMGGESEHWKGGSEMEALERLKKILRQI